MDNQNEQDLLPLARRALASRKRDTPALLRQLGFARSREAVRTLDRLTSPEQHLLLPPEVLAAVAGTGHPDRCLLYLKRFLNATGG